MEEDSSARGKGKAKGKRKVPAKSVIGGREEEVSPSSSPSFGPHSTVVAAAPSNTTTPRRTFYTEGPPDPTKHYMVPVNDSKMKEILTFFTTEDRNLGAAFKFCAVYGHRQAGKSTRLRHIKATLENSELLVVPIDMRRIDQVKDTFYRDLASCIDRYLRNNEPPFEKFPSTLTCGGFQGLFEPEGSFYTHIQKVKKVGLLLLIEEMDCLSCIDQFWCGISTMLESNQDVLEAPVSTITPDQRPQKRFPNILRGVIGVGVHRIVRDSNPGSTSSPPNKKRDILVPHFTKEQVDAHLWQPAERDYNFKFTDDAKDLLFEFIQGHPGLTCRAGTKVLAFIKSQGASSDRPFSFTLNHAVSILHAMIVNAGTETPLNDMVNALKWRFQSGKTLKEVLRPMLFQSARPEVSAAEDELFYAIDKGLLRLEVSENRQEGAPPGGYVDFECPIILHALLPRIFPEADRSFSTNVENSAVINAVKDLPKEFPTLLKGFIHQINIDTLQRGSQKTQRRLKSQESCSETIPAEAAYHFQFYFFLEKALRKDGSVLAELHPWKVKGHERRRIDLYVEGKTFHFGIELAAGIENSKYQTYLDRTEAYRKGFDDKHAFFVLFTTIPSELWSELWKGVEKQPHNEAGTGAFSYIISHDAHFVDWAIHGYNIPKPIVIHRQIDPTEALRAGFVWSYIPLPLCTLRLNLLWLEGVEKLRVTGRLDWKDCTGSPVRVKPLPVRESKQEDGSVNPTRKLFDDGTYLTWKSLLPFIPCLPSL
jgi:hypothetical protein